MIVLALARAAVHLSPSRHRLRYIQNSDSVFMCLLLLQRLQTSARLIALSEPPRETEKWLRLFEQQTPTFKWTPSGLREVQSYPYGVTRGAPRIPFYAAAACFGSNS